MYDKQYAYLILCSWRGGCYISSPTWPWHALPSSQSCLARSWPSRGPWPSWPWPRQPQPRLCLSTLLFHWVSAVDDGSTNERYYWLSLHQQNLSIQPACYALVTCIVWLWQRVKCHQTTCWCVNSWFSNVHMMLLTDDVWLTSFLIFY